MLKSKKNSQTSSKSSKKKPTIELDSVSIARLRILENSKHKLTSVEFNKEKSKILSL